MKKYQRSVTAKLLVLVIIFFSIFCGNTNIIRGESAKNTLELERVWQYLKVFSIHQERLISEDSALKYTSPYDLAASVSDTIHSISSGYKETFTVYYDDYKILESAFGGLGNISADINVVNNSPLASVAYGPLSSKTLYVYISGFQDQTDEELQLLESTVSSYENVVVDLRWNGGGYISTCTTIVDMFLPDSIYFMQTTYRKYPEKELDTGTVLNFHWFTGKRKSPFEEKNVAFLVNPLSASASEILVAAVKDSKSNTYVVGENSFGKNIGQYVFYFDESSGGALKVTSFRFIRKNNSSYYETGIKPDIIVSGTDNFSDLNGDQLYAAVSSLEPGFVKGTDFDKVKEFYDKLVKSKTGSRELSFRYRPECIMGEFHVGENMLLR